MKPTPKIAAAALGGAVATLVAFVLAQVGVDLSPEAAAALATVLAFLAGYIKA